jgi:hypothetical protein
MTAEEPAIACTLDGAAIPGRVLAWDALLGHVGSRRPLPDGGLRLEFREGLPVEDPARVTAAEQQCCAFFSFSITLDHRGTGLEIRSPDGAQEIVSGLFDDADAT